MTIGWHTHLVVILILKWQPDGAAIRFSFPNQNPVLIYQIGKFFCSSSTTPKSQINYSNQQYHLLIANKHQKLLTYCLFEWLIKDLETDEVKMKPGWDVIRFLFYFEMTTEWRTHPVVKFFKSDIRMKCHPVFFFLTLWTGWVCFLYWGIYGIKKSVLGCRKYLSLSTLLIHICATFFF